MSKKAGANPTKEFFVRMITRDISLEDCILDLIDNSVDSAWQSEGSRPMGLEEEVDLSEYGIYIELSSTRFSIRDNCGGMTLDNAVDHAFSFGRKALDNHDDYSIGVYGIGMKRAVFKIGNDIDIRSTYVNKENENESFSVPIAVDEWVKSDEPPWDFDIDTTNSLDCNGVEIEIESLSDGAEVAFSSPAFIEELRRIIGRDYSLHLSRGLNVYVNQKKTIGWPIELRESDDFKPMRFSRDYKTKQGTVAVEIIGGMAAEPPENNDPSERDDGDKRFGWYVVCNGRIVLAADKTIVAGWGGEEWPQWHRQYSGFIGIVLFTAANAAALPLTTTKRSVDSSSEIYRRVHPDMRTVTKNWISYTNARKQSLDEAKAKEAKTKAVQIQLVPMQESVVLPELIPKQLEKSANVHYSVPIGQMKKLATELGNINMAYRDVGIKAFDYIYSDYVGDE